MSSVDREQIRREVTAALRSQLEISTDSPPPHAIITESDVEAARQRGELRFPAGTRFTPLARETFERLTADSRPQSVPLQVSIEPSHPQAPQSSPAQKVVAIGADHGGFTLKETLATHLREQGWQVLDCGTHSQEAVDYPRFAHRVAHEVLAGRAQCGICVDGAGIGSAMAANKVAGIRAAHCHNVVEAKNAREHNHAHLLTLGAGIIGPQMARAIVDAFLSTSWGEGRHARRVALIDPRTAAATSHRTEVSP